MRIHNTLSDAQRKLAKSMVRQLSPEQKIRNVERQKMSQELFKYSRDLIEEFDEVFFPPQAEYYEPGTEKGGKWGTYNHYTQNIIDKNGDYANITLLNENPFIDFWERWNRFKKIKVFL